MRVKIALALILAALALPQLATIVGFVHRLPAAAANEAIASYERRFAEARKFLPRFGVVGYLSDPPNGKEVTEALYETCYHAAEYHLAPLILADSLEPDLILGNFFSDEAMDNALAEHRLVVLHEFQNGVFLLRKKGS